MDLYQPQTMKSHGSASGVTGLLLVYALLITSLIGKSYLFTLYRSLWTVQMIVTVVLIAAFWLHFLFALISSRFSLAHTAVKLRLKLCLFIMLIIGIFSCCIQENIWMNMAFLTTYASSVIILFIFGPQLIEDKNRGRYLNFILFPLVIMVVLSITIFVGNRYNERLYGLYGNAIIAGQMFGITSILLFWKILFHPRKKTAILWILFIVSMTGLLLTRTRTDIAGVCVGITVCVLMAIWYADMEMSCKRAKRLILVFIPLSIVTLLWTVSADFEFASAGEYLRLGENLKETINDRQVYWEFGFERITINNFFGNGPLDKFGEDISLSHSRYDRESNAHNSLFSVIQYYGWVGGLFFILFLFLLLSVFLSQHDYYSVLGISILAFSLVQCISEN